MRFMRCLSFAGWRHSVKKTQVSKHGILQSAANAPQRTSKIEKSEHPGNLGYGSAQELGVLLGPRIMVICKYIFTHLNYVGGACTKGTPFLAKPNMQTNILLPKGSCKLNQVCFRSSGEITETFYMPTHPFRSRTVALSEAKTAAPGEDSSSSGILSGPLQGQGMYVDAWRFGFKGSASMPVFPVPPELSSFQGAFTHTTCNPESSTSGLWRGKEEEKGSIKKNDTWTGIGIVSFMCYIRIMRNPPSHRSKLGFSSFRRWHRT